jgi:hypothetical protein
VLHGILSAAVLCSGALLFAQAANPLITWPRQQPVTLNDDDDDGRRRRVVSHTATGSGEKIANGRRGGWMALVLVMVGGASSMGGDVAVSGWFDGVGQICIRRRKKRKG